METFLDNRISVSLGCSIASRRIERERERGRERKRGREIKAVLRDSRRGNARSVRQGWKQGEKGWLMARRYLGLSKLAG